MAQDESSRLRSLLQREGLVPAAWSNGPLDRYAAHRHDYDKVLVAAAGSIEFEMPEIGQSADLAEADRLDLPAGTLHAAVVGPDGVTCLESHLPRGALPAGLRFLPGWGKPAETNPPEAA
ncbi:MAG: hypothetical protein QOH61_950 [Chloroflexota bacterium]|jgi:hypothetical protein|nr:hypothetical protein [Chloroflexota bacterium]